MILSERSGDASKLAIASERASLSGQVCGEIGSHGLLTNGENDNAVVDLGTTLGLVATSCGDIRWLDAAEVEADKEGRDIER